jgi:hypothetical protein
MLFENLDCFQSISAESEPVHVYVNHSSKAKRKQTAIVTPKKTRKPVVKVMKPVVKIMTSNHDFWFSVRFVRQAISSPEETVNASATAQDTIKNKSTRWSVLEVW